MEDQLHLDFDHVADQSPAMTAARRISDRGPRRNYWSRHDPKEFADYPKFQPLPYLEESRLIQLAQSGDIHSRNLVWIRHVRLAVSIVNRFRIPVHLLADAIQEGILGLHPAITKFEIEKYNAFSTYAWYWVYQRIQRFLLYHRHSVRIPPHLQNDVYSLLTAKQVVFQSYEHERRAQSIARLIKAEPLDNLSTADHPFWIDEEKDTDFDSEAFVCTIKQHLNRRQYFVVKHRYGLENVRAKTLASVASKLKLTRERVRQIESHALDRLRLRLASRRTEFLNDEQCLVESHQTATKQDVFPVTIARANKETIVEVDVSISPDRLESILLNIFKHFTIRQANTLIYFYGLMNTQPIPIEEIAELLALTPRKTRLALRKGRRKLLNYLGRFSHGEIVDLREQIRNDTSIESGDNN